MTGFPDRSHGSTILLSNVRNRGRGADIVDVLDETDSSILDLATQVVRSIPGADVLGVDLVLSSGHATPLDRQSATVIEVNTGASLTGIMTPSEGQSRNPYTAILEDLAADAGIVLAEESKHPTVVLRPRHLTHDCGDVVKLLQRVDGVAIERGRAFGEGLLIVSGPKESLQETIDLMATVAGSVTRVSVTAFPHMESEWFDRVLHPGSVTPDEHEKVLFQGGRLLRSRWFV